MTSLRDTLTRSDREKHHLQERVKSLQNTISELREGKDILIEEQRRSNESVGVATSNGKLSYHGDQVRGHTPSLEELQRVISAMRTVVEKLQRENDGLRREASRGKMREKKENGKREGESGRGRESDREGDEASRQPRTSSLTKLASENDKLVKNLKREMEQNQRLKLSLKTAEIQNAQLKKEVSVECV